MPITGLGAALGQARLSAENAVKAKWRAVNRELTSTEKAQVIVEMKEADSAAIIAFLTLNVVVAVSGPGGAATGVIT